MSKRTKEWFDAMEEVLQKEAKLAGLFENNVEKGNAREFFVKRILGSFIPDSVHIGSGQIISSSDPQNEQPTISKQIDVVIFDSRFPYFRSGSGIGLYPIEGTIATIEVKSMLSRSELFKALDNCLSVMRLPISYKDLEESLERFMKETKYPPKRAPQAYHWYMSPRTYIFSFKGYKYKYENLLDSVEKWHKDRGRPGNIDAPCLPRLIVTEGVIGATRDEFLLLGDYNIFFRATRSKYKLGLLASHLLAVITHRLPAINQATGGEYSMKEYNPGKLYSKEYMGAEGADLNFY